MRVLLVSWGSRGDVQPFVALTRALLEAGHEARLCASADSQALVERHGMEITPLHDDINDFLSDDTVRRAFETNFSGVRGSTLVMSIMRRFRRTMTTVLAEVERAVADYQPDLLVHQPSTPGNELAEKHGVIAVPVCLEPTWIPTSRFPNPLLPFRVPSTLNRATYLWTRLWFRGFVGDLAEWREHVLGLRHPRRRRDPLRRPDGTPATVLQAFSRRVLPEPLDFPSHVRTTGFWYLPAPADWRPSRKLVDFVGAGEPPVYIGFGSSVGIDPDRMGRVVADAVVGSGLRAVVGSGLGGIRLHGAREHILAVDDVPFDWLFPQMAAIVHHGGSGTVGAALASGRPQFICPLSPHQAFYAHRLPAVGAAPPSVAQQDLTPASLARGLGEALSQPQITRRACELGDGVRAEEGLASAIDVLEAEMALSRRRIPQPGPELR